MENKFPINLSGDPSLLDVLIALDDAGFMPVVLKTDEEPILNIVPLSPDCVMTPALARAITRREDELIDRLRRFTPIELFCEMALQVGKSWTKKVFKDNFPVKEKKKEEEDVYGDDESY